MIVYVNWEIKIMNKWLKILLIIIITFLIITIDDTSEFIGVIYSAIIVIGGWVMAEVYNQ